ncbi:MAG: PEP-CTERM sorting domain-containing protein, partial [Planctomycetales bacterium]
GDSHPQLGQALEIRLFNLNQMDLPDPGIEVDFDDVRLDATPIPEPSSWLLLWGAALGLGLRRLQGTNA